MAFQSLYRKYRPQTFGALVGQESVSTALRNAVREDRIGHAYLFSGPRGTGKTTSARLLAKAINCEHRTPEGEPDNVCPSCVEITSGTSMDVVELDAASNRGVSEMRTLLERVAYRSAGGARKVYIVDEVHMLTKEASTALLKTLEEPPAHVVFVLATTDPQMVLATIKSRTQHFEFSLLGAGALAAHLADVARQEGVEADDATLLLVARRAGGSARDALSLLDQALAYGEGRLDADQVRALFGGSAFASRSAVLDALGAGDVPTLLETLDGLLGAGTDARTLADDLLRHLREVFLVSQGAGRLRLESPEEERAVLGAQGSALGPALVVRALEALGEASVEIRRAPDPRLVLEVALVRLARRDTTAVEALAERLSRLERAIDDIGRGGAGALPRGTPPDPRVPQQGNPPEPRVPETGPQRGPRAALGALRAQNPPAASRLPEPLPQPQPQPQPSPGPAAAPPVPDAAPAAVPVAGPSSAPSSPAAAPPSPAAAESGSAEPAALEDVRLAWPGALDHLKPRLKAMAKESRPVRVDGTTVILGIPSRFSAVHLPTITGDARTVAAALGAELGREVAVRVEVAEADDDPLESFPTYETDTDTDMAAEEERRAEVSVARGSRPAPVTGLDSPVGLVIETFGATIESESVRD